MTTNELLKIIRDLVEQGYGTYPVYYDGYEVDKVEKREISINYGLDDINVVIIE